MPYELLSQYLRLPVFMMVAARLGGMIMFQPVLAANSLPRQVRVLFILGLGVLLTPLVGSIETVPDTVLGLIIALAGELLLGLLVGLVPAIIFIGMQMGGTLIAQESGLAFGQIADPSSGLQLSVLSSLYGQLIAIVFLIAGGHRVLLAACLDSFQTIPLLGDAGLATVGAEMLVDALALGTALAVRVAAPAVLTLFLVNLALGFISRTVPQLNIATIGFSLKALVGFVVMAVALPSAVAAFMDALELSFDWVHQLVGG